MLRTVGSLLGEHKVALAIAALVASLTLMLYVRGQQLNAANALLKARTMELSIVGDKLKEQNKAVEALKQAGDKQSADSAAAAKKSAAIVAATNARLAALERERAKVPKTCTGAMQWLREQAQQSKGWADQ